MNTNARFALAFDAIILAVFVGMAVIATDFSPLARTFPLAVSVMGVVLAAARLVTHLRMGGISDLAAGNGVSTDDPSAVDAPATVKRVVYFFGWIIGYLLLIRVVGFLIGSAVFLVAFLWIEARIRWLHIAIVVAVSLTLVSLLGSQMGVVWPVGLVNR